MVVDRSLEKCGLHQRYGNDHNDDCRKTCADARFAERAGRLRLGSRGQGVSDMGDDLILTVASRHDRSARTSSPSYHSILMACFPTQFHRAPNSVCASSFTLRSDLNRTAWISSHLLRSIRRYILSVLILELHGIYQMFAFKGMWIGDEDEAMYEVKSLG